MAHAKTTLIPLYAEADEPRVRPVLDALRQKRFSVSDDAQNPKTDGIVLFFLSENIGNDAAAIDRFLALDTRKAEIIPVNLDGSTPPAPIGNAIMARNTIFAERYSVEELAGRIADAAVKPAAAVSRTRNWIIAAAAAAVLALVGIVLWRVIPKGSEPAAAEAAPAPTAEPRIPQAAGISAEELERVYELIIIGEELHYFTGTEGIAEKNGWARIGAEYFANRTEEDGIAHWYSKADGHEIERAAWNDLDFLRYMKNAKLITLVCVEGELPDLSGLKRLDNVELFDCNTANIEGLRNTGIINFGYSGNSLSDFSPLSSCSRLHYANLRLYAPIPQDLTSFGPPGLTELFIDTDNSGSAVDLSGLRNCRELSTVTLDGLPLNDLSCLSECKKLQDLELLTMPDLVSVNGLADHQSLTHLHVDDQCENLSDMSALADNTSLRYVDLHSRALSDLSWLSNANRLSELQIWGADGLRNLNGLEEHTSLQHLHIEYCERLSDVSALSTCTSLITVRFHEVFALSDISPVVKLPDLRSLEIYGSRLKDVGFLSEIVNKNSFSFGVSEVEDWSGLAAIPRYNYLNITDRNGSALSYIRNTPVAVFELWNREGMTNLNEGALDLMQLPDVTRSLTLHCVRSLETLRSMDLWELYLDDCPQLTSLDGLERLHNLSSLRVQNCSRLTDWSAVEKKTFDNLELVQLFTLPDFSALHADRLRLESIFDLPDLSALASYEQQNYHIELFDVDKVTDLSPLFHLNGSFLKVPARLQEQAEALVESGLLDRYEVEYPDSWWEPAEPHIVLLSFDELDTLPEAVLRRVKHLQAVGDRIFSWEDYRLDQQWENGEPTFVLRSSSDGENGDIVIEHPGTLTDFSKLAALTGLEELSLTYQSLASIEGIQNLQELRNLEISFTPALMDASPAFTLQGLEKLHLQYTGVTSIQGIQNLQNLHWMDLNGLELDDLTPLGGVPEDCDLAFDFPLMTCDAFFALPDSVLSRIREIGFFGNYVMRSPWGDLWVEEDWNGGDRPDLYLHDSASDERIPAGEGTVADLSFLNRLPNLEMLHLYGQPIESLDGIGTAGKLRSFDSRWTGLSDLSPLFDLPQIQIIRIENTETVTSIDGIQKLPHLTDLNIGGNGLTDIRAIGEIDYTFCTEPDEDGNVPYFILGVDNLQGKIPDEQYAVLSAVPEYQSLNVFNTDCALWMDAVKNVKIHELHAGNCRFTDETFRTFIEQHPELEYIKVSWTPELRDISPLLTLRNLRAACVSHDMRSAIESLGDGFGFELEIE